MNEFVKMREKETYQKAIENKILKQLSLNVALGEIALYEMVIPSNDPSMVNCYNRALLTLEQQGIIEIVSNANMSVVRLMNVYH